MSQFFSWLQSNYQYIIFSLEFLGTLIATVVAILRGNRVSDLRNESKILSELYFKQGKKLSFYGLLPTMVRSANILYPVHGDGEKRFEYVYQNFLRLLGCEDSLQLRSEVFFAVQAVLNADKLEKISRDTLDEEPKKEFYETFQSFQAERSEDLPQNCGEEQTSKCRTSTFQRRN